MDHLLLGSGGGERHSLAPAFHCPCTRQRALQSLQLLDAEELHVATGSGDILVTLDRASSGEFHFASGSGDLELQLPDDASIEVHAETHSGKVRVSLDGDIRYRKQDADEVEFTLGGGQAEIEMATGSGDIRIGRL